MKQIVELDYKGIKVKGIRISVKTELPAHMDKIWHKIQDVETLRYITKPKLYFFPLEDLPPQWNNGDTYVFKTWMHGFIPIGKHTIQVMYINKEKREIYTNENNVTVKIWNHFIKMRKITEEKTYYEDTVDIYAGFLTRFIAWWSIKFYQHRQKKWLTLLK